MMRARGPDAGEIARALAARIAALAPELLPGGRREGHEWRAGSLAGERGSSLGVHLAGAKAGVWCDFASGECGDALDLVAQCRFRGDKRAAIEWATRWLGLPLVGGQSAESAPRPDPRTEERQADGGDARRRAAQRIWLEAVPITHSDTADIYLRRRGIDLVRLGRAPRSLRYHRALPHRCGRSFDALVAAVCDGDGRHIATHRIWLDASGDKANIAPNKMSLGSVAGGTIRIWRGASGKPLREAPEGETVVLGEGIETCLSIALACPELRVLCAVSLGNMARIALPEAVGTVILAADNDDGAQARAGLQRALNRFVAQGRDVRLARAPWGSDFNDVLRAA